MRPHQTNVEVLASTHAQELNDRLDSAAQGVRPSDATVSLYSVDHTMLPDSTDCFEDSSILWGDVSIEWRP
jgi:hypothetical protein